MLSFVNLSFGSASYIVKISNAPKSLTFFENFGEVNILKTKKQRFLSINTKEVLKKDQIRSLKVNLGDNTITSGGKSGLKQVPGGPNDL